MTRLDSTIFMQGVKNLSDLNNAATARENLGLENVSNINWGDVSSKTDNYTLQTSDNGKVITVNSATDKTITLPDSLSSEFSCTVIQLGAGQVSFSGSDSMIIQNRQSHTKTAGQYAAASLYIYSNNNCILQGDTTS